MIIILLPIITGVKPGTGPVEESPETLNKDYARKFKNQEGKGKALTAEDTKKRRERNIKIKMLKHMMIIE